MFQDRCNTNAAAVLQAYNKNKQFYDNLIELQKQVELYKKLCIQQEKKSRNLLILQQKLQSTPFFYMRSYVMSMSKFRSMTQSSSTQSPASQHSMSHTILPPCAGMNDLNFSKSINVQETEDSTLSDQITITKTIDGIEQETISDYMEYSTSDDTQTQSPSKTFMQMTAGNRINEERLQQKVRFSGLSCFQDPSMVRNIVQQIK